MPLIEFMMGLRARLVRISAENDRQNSLICNFEFDGLSLVSLEFLGGLGYGDQDCLAIHSHSQATVSPAEGIGRRTK